MWQKIKCMQGYHDWKLEIVKCGNKEQGSILSYDEQTEQIYATVAINVTCKHCKKRLVSHIVRAGYSAKELGLRKDKR